MAPSDNPTKPFDREGFRARVAASGDHFQGSAELASRIERRYHSNDPVHVAAVDANALRCEVHALAQAQPAVELNVAARTLDVAADVLGNYAEAAGV